jgi:hypothetical protein
LARPISPTFSNLAEFEVITSGYRLLLPQWIPGVSWLANRLVAKLPGIRKLCLVHQN